jgi:hypothetical protein
MDEDLIQVQYAEERDRSSAAAVQRSIMIDTQFLVEGEVETLLDAARDLVDKGLVLIRNPPQVRAPRGGIGDDDEPEPESE